MDQPTPTTESKDEKKDEKSREAGSGSAGKKDKDEPVEGEVVE